MCARGTTVGSLGDIDAALGNNHRMAEGIVADQAGKRLHTAHNFASLPQAAWNWLACSASSSASNAFFKCLFDLAGFVLQERPGAFLVSPLVCSFSNSARGTSDSLSLVPNKPRTGSVARLAV